jgi:hypothetical protein
MAKQIISSTPICVYMNDDMYSHTNETTPTGIQLNNDVGTYITSPSSKNDSFDCKTKFLSMYHILQAERFLTSKNHKDKQTRLSDEYSNAKTVQESVLKYKALQDSVKKFGFHPYSPIYVCTKKPTTIHVHSDANIDPRENMNDQEPIQKSHKASNSSSKTKPRIKTIEKRSQLNTFPFKTIEECISKSSTKSYYISKKDLIDIIKNDSVLKKAIGPKLSSMTKEEICAKLLGGI